MLAATGGALHRFSLSHQDNSRIIQRAAGKITDGQGNDRSVELNLRGTIYDRHLEELSVSYQLFTLYVHPAELTDRRSSVEKLARVLGMDRELFAERLKNVKAVIEIADDLDKQQAADVAALNLDGVYCQAVEERFYPAHKTAAHLLGFVSNNTGLAGVEALYESVLQPGVFRSTDVPEVDFNDFEPSGRTTTDVILTIDLDLQKQVEQQLRAYRESIGAARGVALVIAPGSGRVLAMASQPGFDPNYFWQADSWKLQDLVFQPDFARELVRPLLLTAAAIYEAGLGGQVLPVTVRAPDYGFTEDRLEKYWRLFGFQNPVRPILPADGEQGTAGGPEAGNGSRLSGAQMEVALASLLNGGRRVTPYILHSLYNHSRQQYYFRADHSSRQRIIGPVAGIHLRRELLLNSPYSNKDGFLFYNSNVGISESKGLTEYRIQEVLLAAVPRKLPNVLLLMAVDYGNLYPLPAGAVNAEKKKRELAALGRKLLPVLRGYGEQVQIADRPGEKNEDNYRRFLISRRIEVPEQKKSYVQVNKIMPQVTGLSLRKGLQRISPYHLKVRVKGSGRIVAQTPAPGESLAETGACELILQSQI